MKRLFYSTVYFVIDKRKIHDNINLTNLFATVHYTDIFCESL